MSSQNKGTRTRFSMWVPSPQLPFPRDLIGLQDTNAPVTVQDQDWGSRKIVPLLSTPEGPKLDQVWQGEAPSSFYPKKYEDRKPLLCSWEGKISCNHKALFPNSYGNKYNGGTPSLRDAKGVSGGVILVTMATCDILPLCPWDQGCLSPYSVEERQT